jgi:hypothetical protein
MRCVTYWLDTCSILHARKRRVVSRIANKRIEGVLVYSVWKAENPQYLGNKCPLCTPTTTAFIVHVRSDFFKDPFMEFRKK